MELLSFCNVRKGDITLYVAFLFILWYEAKDVAPWIQAVEIPLAIIIGIAAYAAVDLWYFEHGGLHIEIGRAANGDLLVVNVAEYDWLAVVMLQGIWLEVSREDGAHVACFFGLVMYDE